MGSTAVGTSAGRFSRLPNLQLFILLRMWQPDRDVLIFLTKFFVEHFLSRFLWSRLVLAAVVVETGLNLWSYERGLNQVRFGVGKRRSSDRSGVGYNRFPYGHGLDIFATRSVLSRGLNSFHDMQPQINFFLTDDAPLGPKWRNTAASLGMCLI